MGLLRDAEDLGQAVVELSEELGGLDGHPAKEVVEGLRVEQRLERQRLPDEPVRVDTECNNKVRTPGEVTASRSERKPG